MPISRSQMNRQLRMGGGIMNIQPRQQYGLGSFVKKITKGVKKVAKSPLGKAAILGAVGFGIPGMGASGGLGGGLGGGAGGPSDRAVIKTPERLSMQSYTDAIVSAAQEADISNVS